MKKYCAFFVAIFLLMNGLYAQMPFTMKAKKCIIPFEFHRNIMVVKAYINNKGPYRFVVDTGVNILLITDSTLKKTLHLKQATTLKIAGVGENAALDAWVCYNVKIQIGKVVGENQNVAVLRTGNFDLSEYIGSPVHGIIGYSLFQNFAVTLDFPNQKIKVQQPQYFAPPKDFTKIPLQIIGQKPYMQCTVWPRSQDSLQAKLLIDTGAGLALSLEQDSILRVPSERLRTQIGVGLGGNIGGYLARVPKIKVANSLLNNVIASFPDHKDLASKRSEQRNGTIGNELLRRFVVVFNYADSCLYLKPSRKYLKQPFEHDMCGIELIVALAKGEKTSRYFIRAVQPNSPAQEAGLTEDDEILAINFRLAREMSVGQIDKIFHSGHEQKLLLQIARDGEIIYKMVQLRRQI